MSNSYKLIPSAQLASNFQGPSDSRCCHGIYDPICYCSSLQASNTRGTHCCGQRPCGRRVHQGDTRFKSCHNCSSRYSGVLQLCLHRSQDGTRGGVRQAFYHQLESKFFDFIYWTMISKSPLYLTGLI